MCFHMSAGVRTARHARLDARDPGSTHQGGGQPHALPPRGRCVGGAQRVEGERATPSTVTRVAHGMAVTSDSWLRRPRDRLAGLAREALALPPRG